MQGCRDEYGHYVSGVKSSILMSQHIEPEPRIVGGIPLDTQFLAAERLEMRDYIQHLKEICELSGSLEFF